MAGAASSGSGGCHRDERRRFLPLVHTPLRPQPLQGALDAATRGSRGRPGRPPRVPGRSNRGLEVGVGQRVR